MPIPKPLAGEDEKTFTNRILALPEMATEYPKEQDRPLVAAAIFKHRKNSSDEAWPMVCECRHIQPGLVAYKDIEDGMPVLVDKTALDKMLPSFVGKPVYDLVHHDDPKAADFQNGTADGIVTEHWFNAEDGWYWAKFIVWDEVTKRHLRSDVYSVSCAYDILDLKAAPTGATHNSVPYCGEFLDGEYTHLAIVPNPRYEGARIVILNSKDGGVMFKFWNFLKGIKVSNEAEEGKTVKVDGEVIPLKMLVDTWKAEEAEKAKKAELEAQNAAKEVGEDTVIELDGKETPVKNMIENWREVKNRKNAEEEKAKKEHDEKHDKFVENCASCNARKNAEDKEAADKAEKAKADKEAADKLTAKNAADNAAAKAAALAKAAAHRGEPQQPKITSRREQAEEGARRYGSAK